MDVPTIAVIGAGPRGTGLIERLAANAAELLPAGAGHACAVHVVDEFEAGSGRVWRRGQSPLLWMNSRAADITMFTDSSVRCAGPVRTGPTLYEWARSAASELGTEVGASSFAGRRFAGGYLRWCFRQAAEALPANVQLTVHEARAVSLSLEADGAQVLRLSTGDAIRADVVVLAVGNQRGMLDEQQREFASFAVRTGAGYLPPDYTADIDLDVLPAGEPVIVSGIGQAFADLMALVTEGRGGAFEGGRYVPSGREPVLCVGSRRGVPAYPKPAQSPVTSAPDEPRFATPELLKELLTGDAPGRGQAWWEAVLKELDWVYERELLARGLPDRLDRRDRLDLPSEHSPLARREFDGEPALRAWMDGYLRRRIVRATDARFSGQAAAANALIELVGVMHTAAVSAASAGPLDAEVAAVYGRVGRLARLMTSGLPPRRFEQLRALAAAGVVRFLGAGLEVSTEGDGASSGRFVARTRSLPGQQLGARYLVEARLPQDDVRAEGAELLADLVRSGGGRAEVGAGGAARLAVDQESFAVLGRDGQLVARRYALGAFATGGALGALSRPCTDAAFFRQNDDLARRILGEIAGIQGGG